MKNIIAERVLHKGMNRVTLRFPYAESYLCLRTSKKRIALISAGRSGAEQKPVKNKTIERIQGQDSTHF